ncbi:MAG: hypothetical protein HY700_19175 [Gemmatimonadetes bacterium]|nr:hypothetical protein [Gemmatimonadota bacterium]
MEHRITATELVRRLGDVLGRIRYRGDRFTVERNGVPVAQLIPVPSAHPGTLREALSAWCEAGEPEPDFADALERIGKADRVPKNPWES